ncbi:hypothetical protein ANN_12967 [Periplaneta americana]|uniref:C2 domain-containing protein n=1 Tax=Periplaneta americana TaxID=6978 RepID=A0ABQ8TJ37_PERAM|nr:hypothetical protein ANN_12967 [Periplaneta americana]
MVRVYEALSLATKFRASDARDERNTFTPIDTAEDLVARVVEVAHVIRDNVGLFERCRHSIIRSSKKKAPQSEDSTSQMVPRIRVTEYLENGDSEALSALDMCEDILKDTPQFLGTIKFSVTYDAETSVLKVQVIEAMSPYFYLLGRGSNSIGPHLSLPRCAYINTSKQTVTPPLLFEKDMILRDMLLELNDSCEQYGMKISANKTKTIVMGRKVKKADRLPECDTIVITCDPYVKVSLLPERNQEFQTRVRKGTFHPKWMDIFYFDGLALRNERWFESSRRRNFLMKFRSDPYVKVTFLKEKKVISTHKTKIVKNTMNPNFNESFSCSAPVDRLNDYAVEIEVMHNSGIGKGDLVGRIVLAASIYYPLYKRGYSSLLALDLIDDRLEQRYQHRIVQLRLAALVGFVLARDLRILTDGQTVSPVATRAKKSKTGIESRTKLPVSVKPRQKLSSPMSSPASETTAKSESLLSPATSDVSEGTSISPSVGEVTPSTRRASSESSMSAASSIGELSGNERDLPADGGRPASRAPTPPVNQRGAAERRSPTQPPTLNPEVAPGDYMTARREDIPPVIIENDYNGDPVTVLTTYRDESKPLEINCKRLMSGFGIKTYCNRDYKALISHLQQYHVPFHLVEARNEKAAEPEPEAPAPQQNNVAPSEGQWQVAGQKGKKGKRTAAVAVSEVPLPVTKPAVKETATDEVFALTSQPANSDHKPVIITFRAQLELSPPKTVLMYQAADWDLFRDKLDALTDDLVPTSSDEIEEAAKMLTNAIQESMSHNGRIYHSPEEKATVFAEVLENSFNPHGDLYDRQIHDQITQDITTYLLNVDLNNNEAPQIRPASVHEGHHVIGSLDPLFQLLTLLWTFNTHIRTDHVRYTLRYLHCFSVVSCPHTSDSALNKILKTMKIIIVAAIYYLLKISSGDINITTRDYIPMFCVSEVISQNFVQVDTTIISTSEADNGMLDSLLKELNQKTFGIIHVFLDDAELLEIPQQYKEKILNYIFLAKNLDDLLMQIDTLRDNFVWNNQARFLVLTKSGEGTSLAVLILQELWETYKVMNAVIGIHNESLVQFYTAPIYQTNKKCGTITEAFLSNQCGIESEGKLFGSKTLYPIKLSNNNHGCPIKVCIANAKDIEILFMNKMIKSVNLTSINQEIFLQNISIYKKIHACIQDVLFGNADIAYGGIPLVLEISELVDFSIPYFEIKYTWYVPCAMSFPRLQRISQIFSASLWIAICFCIFLVTVVLWYLAKKVMESNSYNNFYSVLYNVWAIIMGVSVTEMPRTTCVRLIIFPWICSCFAISTIFQTFFTSYLVDPGFQKQISSLDELIESGIDYGFISDFDIYFAGSKHKNHQILMKRINNYSVSKDSYIQNIIDTGHYATLAESWYVENYLNSVHDGNAVCRMNDYESFTNRLVLCISKGSVMLEQLNKAITSFIESGIIAKAASDIRNSSRYFNNIYDDYFVFSINHLMIAFYVLICGYILSSFVFLSEVFYSRYANILPL